MTAGPDVPLLSFFILFDRRPCGFEPGPAAISSKY